MGAGRMYEGTASFRSGGDAGGSHDTRLAEHREQGCVNTDTQTIGETGWAIKETLRVGTDTVGYLHLDVDALDPGVGQANSFPVRGGLSVEELTAAIAAIRVRTPLGAAALTSYAPEYDPQEGVPSSLRRG